MDKPILVFFIIYYLLKNKLKRLNGKNAFSINIKTKTIKTKRIILEKNSLILYLK